MIQRKFALENTLGEVYHLNASRNFLHDPDDLGFQRKTSFVKIQNDYHILTDSFNQHKPSGTICFSNNGGMDSYQRFAKFSRFLQHTPLTLYYRADREYRMDVLPSKVEKTERNSAFGMDIDVEFTGLTPWYLPIVATGDSSVVIESDSVAESPVHLMITGGNTWSQSVDGKQVLSGRVTQSTASWMTLHVRTDTNPFQIYKVSGSGSDAVDMYSYSDFNTDRFPFLQYGRNVFSCNGSAITVEARAYYETV